MHSTVTNFKYPRLVSIRKLLIINLKTNIMRTFIRNTPTETRRNSFFSTFKNSKRVQWASLRNHTH